MFSLWKTKGDGLLVQLGRKISNKGMFTAATEKKALTSGLEPTSLRESKVLTVSQERPKKKTPKI